MLRGFRIFLKILMVIAVAAWCGFWIGHQGHVHVTRLFIQQQAALKAVAVSPHVTAHRRRSPNPVNHLLSAWATPLPYN